MVSQGRLDKDYQKELNIKGYIEMAVRLFLSMKNDEYLKLTEEQRRIFDNMYPDIVARERFINLVAQAADYLTFGSTATFGAHVAAASMGFMLLSGFMSFVALGLMVIGIAIIVSTVIYREFSVNRKREAILKEGGVQIAFKAVHDLTSGRDETLEQLTDLEHYYDDLGRKLVGEDDNDFQFIISETKNWIKDARDLLSDEAVNIIKDGILKHRDNSENPVASDVKLEDVAHDLYQQKIQGKVKDVIRDPITHLDHFKKGWRKLTKLSPDDRPEIISKIDYDMLYRDYLDNRARIDTSVVALNLVADAMNSNDPKMLKRIHESSKSVAEQLRLQSSEFAREKLTNRSPSKDLSIDTSKLVSGQRSYNPAKIIELGFADIGQPKPRKGAYHKIKKMLGLSRKNKDHQSKLQDHGPDRHR